MFHRSGTSNKIEITAPPNDLANKLRLQHPPPALLLVHQQHSSFSPSKTTKQPVQRNKSHPLIDPDDRFSTSVEVDRARSPTRNHALVDKRSKKKNVFSFLKKSRQQPRDTDEPPPPRNMSRTPEGFGRKHINYDHPGSVPPVRRPHSSASDRHNGINPSRNNTRRKKYLDSEDEDCDDVPITGYPRFKPVRVAPPIPVQAQQLGTNGGYDSLEKFRNLRSSQSDDGGSLVSSSAHSTSLSSGVNNMDINVPGLIGIKNHGNTCFMNAVMQCLSNTEPLLNYFLTNAYKKDLASSMMKRGKTQQLATSNSSQVNDAATGLSEMLLMPTSDSAVTECVGLLIKSLWNAQYESKVSVFVRDVVAQWGQQYRGNNQHDAQEFLLWLLDHLHEDLNQATGERVTMVSDCIPQLVIITGVMKYSSKLFGEFQ